MNLRYPSVETLQKRLLLDETSAKRVRGLMMKTIAPESSTAVQNWLKHCCYRPSAAELILCAIDETLDTFGVEAIEGCWIDYYHQNIQAIYCNTGCTYAPTIFFCHKQNRFIITSLDTYVRRNGL